MRPRRTWRSRSARSFRASSQTTRPVRKCVARVLNAATRPTAGVGRKTREPASDTRSEGRCSMAGQKIRIRLKAYDHEVIDTSARKIVDTVTRTGAKVAGPVPLPTEKNVYCVIRSPHKYKDSRE